MRRVKMVRTAASWTGKFRSRDGMEEKKKLVQRWWPPTTTKFLIEGQAGGRAKIDDLLPVDDYFAQWRINYLLGVLYLDSRPHISLNHSYIQLN